MALIIEDGTVVANANSFITDLELTTYADNRGVTYPAAAPDREFLIFLAMDYILAQEKRLQGVRIDIDQELPFPRRNVCVNDFLVPSDTIHKNVKNAQIELALQVQGSELLINATTSNLASFSVDGVYSESYHKGGSWEKVRTGKADAYLLPLMIDTKKLVRT